MAQTDDGCVTQRGAQKLASVQISEAFFIASTAWSMLKDTAR
jgi:hypothetical protein